MQIRPAIERKIQCNSVELLESRTSDEANNNTTDTANAAQNAPQDATYNPYEATSLEEPDDDEELPF